MYLSFYCNVVCERELESEQRLQYIDSTFMAISVMSFSFSWCSTRGPGVQLSAECWLSLPHLVTNGSPKLLGVPRAPSARCGFPYHIWSLTSSDLQLTGGPEGPFGRVWLSLPHLVPNFVWSPTHLGSRGPLLLGSGFHYHTLSLTSLIPNCLTSCLDLVI